jgi:predicted lactoylglutathione lyase
MSTAIIINIDVPELAPAIRFYTAALGLTHCRTLDDDTAELTAADPAGLCSR